MFVSIDPKLETSGGPPSAMAPLEEQLIILLVNTGKREDVRPDQKTLG